MDKKKLKAERQGRISETKKTLQVLSDQWFKCPDADIERQRLLMNDIKAKFLYLKDLEAGEA